MLTKQSKKSRKIKRWFVRTKILFPEVNVCLHKGAATNYSLRICHFPKAYQKPPTAHLPILREPSFDWIYRVGRGFPAIPTNEILPCRQQMTFPLIQRKIERMAVFMLWLLTFVTTLAAKNGAFVHHGNILVTAKMVICVSVAKIKLHTAVIKY